MPGLKLPESREEYIKALTDAAELGAQKALEKAGISKPFLKLREAQRLYGTAIVNRWIREGLINPVKDGDATSTVRIDRIQIEAVWKSANRSTYMSTEEMRADNMAKK